MHKPFASLWKTIKHELNFYRVHLIYFTLVPLIASAIFYASNGQHPVRYIDALFNCVSAMCVCGLASINLSSLTPWQQTILFILMTLGNPVIVSWFMVLTRRHHFARRFQHILASKAAQGAANIIHQDEERRPWTHRVSEFLRPRNQLTIVAEDSESSKTDKRQKRGVIRKLRPDMIRRMDDAPKLVNPSGWVTDQNEPSLMKMSPMHTNTVRGDNRNDPASVESNTSENYELPSRNPSAEQVASLSKRPKRRRLSDPGLTSRPSTPTRPMQRFETMMDGGPNKKNFPRQQTIEFAPTVQVSRARPEQPPIREFDTISIQSNQNDRQATDLRSMRRPSLAPHYTMATHVTRDTTHTAQTHRTMRSAKTQGFGGFPMPHKIIGSLFDKFFPRVKRQLTRTVTIPTTTSLVPSHGMSVAPPNAKPVPYISFNAVVGRNSTFHLLTSEQINEIGGVEYRALNALLWIVAGYHLGVQLIAYIIIGPYMSMGKWRSTLEPPTQIRPIPNGWFSLYQTTSAYTNTGMSLVDQSVVPFQKAYLLVVMMIFLILAGNCAYPILLRLLIWSMTKFIPKTSRLNETLRFLLDHPRRCYTHLFPSHQTWFLLTIVFILTSIDWFCFMVLDIGNPVIEEIPLHTRVSSGLFQAVAVRAAGFGIVPLASLSPAVKVLYTVMMYVSVYPIAMSVRSTNVYEEQSLGIFNDDREDALDKFEPYGDRMNVWSRYLTLHVRRQLAFDMWWLAIAMFFVCIVERREIIDPTSDSWFNPFTVLFEVVSAYGGVGLSLGTPTDNFSLCGTFRPLSKLIMCMIMLRGRHRGLPVAIDRAILLPSEFDDQEQSGADAQPTVEEENGQSYNMNGMGMGTRYDRASVHGSEYGQEYHFQRRRSQRQSMHSASEDVHPRSDHASGPLSHRLSQHM